MIHCKNVRSTVKRTIKGPLTTYYSKNSDYKIIKNYLRSNQLNTLDTNKINIIKQNRFLISSTNILE